MTTLKIAIVIFAIVSIGLTGITVQSFAMQHFTESDNQENERAWVITLLYHDNDPTTKIGYSCAHGHMSFGC